jgi:hypothetical protein
VGFDSKSIVGVLIVNCFLHIGLVRNNCQDCCSHLWCVHRLLGVQWLQEEFESTVTICCVWIRSNNSSNCHRGTLLRGHHTIKGSDLKSTLSIACQHNDYIDRVYCGNLLDLFRKVTSVLTLPALQQSLHKCTRLESFHS